MTDIDTPEQRAIDRFKERGVIDPDHAAAVARWLALANGDPEEPEHGNGAFEGP